MNTAVQIMHEDFWHGYPAIMVLCVSSLCDNTVKKLFLMYVCLLCCIYFVKMFTIPYFKWLVIIFCHKATHIFRVHKIRFPDITLSQFLHHCRLSVEKCKTGALLHSKGFSVNAKMHPLSTVEHYVSVNSKDVESFVVEMRSGFHSVVDVYMLL